MGQIWNFLSQLEPSDWAIVWATMIGPVLAVQAQKWIERAGEKAKAKAWICSTLMSTRQTRLSPDHVRALNMIDLAFYGRVVFGRRWQSDEDKRVTDAWKIYLDTLYTDNSEMTPAQNDILFKDRTTKFQILLAAIATANGYSFDAVQLEKGAYTPNLHTTTELKQRELLDKAVAVMSGEQAIKMDIGKFPVNEQAQQAHQKMIEQIVEVTAGGRLNVKTSTDSTP